MAKVLITGANGQLGNEMRCLAEKDKKNTFLFTDVQDLDITDSESVMKFVTDHNIDIIVNCAAYTAVDKAEDDEELCRKINALAVENLAKAAVVNQAKIIHISTDYVYSGVHYKPYSESDETAPCSVYGVTKLEGERLLFDNCSEAVVLRTSWLYSTFGNNFVKTMIRLGKERERLNVIFDQIGTPTYAGDLAKMIMTIIDSGTFIPGVYNFSNEGVCSWYDFTKTIHRIAGITTCKVMPIEGREYPSRAIRPYYSVMNKRKIKETYAVSIPYWEESLVKCINLLMK
ncbi:dTDP-4-dehydrorhamnose reductase [Coprobacter sp.]